MKMIKQPLISWSA